MITGPRRLVLVGHPVRHSLSPIFQNAALVHAGIALRYESVDVAPASLAETMRALVRHGAAGNVTIPHKVAVARLCAELRPAAARTGAVNTFWVEDGLLVGDNTDVDGFAALVLALRGTSPRDAVVGVFGAGGAAAAVLAAVERWAGCTVLLHNRSSGRAVTLCERFRSIARVADVVDMAARADLVINATALGLRDREMPIDPALLRSGADVLDLVYRSGETAWVRAARESGHRAMDGLAMLIEQGAQAFALWFGLQPDREVMWKAVREGAAT